MKAVIGLIPLYDDEKESYWMLPGYMKALELCGALPIMLPLTRDEEELDRCITLCDGFLLTGGHDVNPAKYGQKKKETCGSLCELRDEMESYILNRAIEEDIPVLGICRGVQLLNVHLGGSLYQDLPTEYDSKISHRMDAPYDREAHKVEVLPDTLLADIIGEGLHGVNSCHHQAIQELAVGVQKMAVAEDGIVEAISMLDKKFIMGVQWHPEFSYRKNEDSRKIMQAFVEHC